jgi:hypothetical protein
MSRFQTYILLLKSIYINIIRVLRKIVYLLKDTIMKSTILLIDCMIPRDGIVIGVLSISNAYAPTMGTSHTYHSRFIPAGVAEASKIFL